MFSPFLLLLVDEEPLLDTYICTYLHTYIYIYIHDNTRNRTKRNPNHTRPCKSVKLLGIRGVSALL